MYVYYRVPQVGFEITSATIDAPTIFEAAQVLIRDFWIFGAVWALSRLGEKVQGTQL